MNKKYIQNLFNSLNTNEQTVCTNYKTNNESYCNKINAALINNIKEEILLYKNDIETLDSIIKKHQCKDDIILHRSTTSNYVLPFIVNNETNYHNPNFLSTSQSIDCIQGFFLDENNKHEFLLPVYMKIICHKNTFMFPYINDYNEDEILLGRNMNFLINKNILIRNISEIENLLNGESSRFQINNMKQLRFIEVETI